MASPIARSARNHAVRKRLDGVLGEIAERLGIEIPPEPRRMKDHELQPIVELERFADFAESVGAAVAARDAAHAATMADLNQKMAAQEKDFTARIAALDGQVKAATAKAKTAAAKDKAAS